MNKDKLQEKADAMQKELDALKAEINKPECVDIFKQKGVWHNVWDSSCSKSKGYVHRKLHSFDEGGYFYGMVADNDKGLSWENHELAYPQWVEIPDDMMEDPDIKGRFVVELKNGEFSGTWMRVGDFVWDLDSDHCNRIKRVCILEKQ